MKCKVAGFGATAVVLWCSYGMFVLVDCRWFHDFLTHCTLYSLMQDSTCDCVCLGTVGGDTACENLLLGAEITGCRNPNRLLI